MLDTDHQVIAFPLSDRIAQNRLAQLDDVVAITASMVGVAELRDWDPDISGNVKIPRRESFYETLFSWFF